MLWAPPGEDHRTSPAASPGACALILISSRMSGRNEFARGKVDRWRPKTASASTASVRVSVAVGLSIVRKM